MTSLGNTPCKLLGGIRKGTRVFYESGVLTAPRCVENFLADTQPYNCGEERQSRTDVIKIFTGFMVR